MSGCLSWSLRAQGGVIIRAIMSWVRKQVQQQVQQVDKTALCAGGEVVPAQTPCESQTPGGLRDERTGQAGAVGIRLADPDGLCREAQSGPAPAGGCSRPSGQHALHGRGQLGTASGVVSKLPQLLPAACQPTLASGCA